MFTVARDSFLDARLTTITNSKALSTRRIESTKFYSDLPAQINKIKHQDVIAHSTSDEAS